MWTGDHVWIILIGFYLAGMIPAWECSTGWNGWVRVALVLTWPLVITAFLVVAVVGGVTYVADRARYHRIKRWLNGDRPV